jgi:hypothetical protein
MRLVGQCFSFPFGIAQDLFTSFSRRELVAAHQARQDHQTNAKLRTDVSTWPVSYWQLGQQPEPSGPQGLSHQNLLGYVQ